MFEVLKKCALFKGIDKSEIEISLKKIDYNLKEYTKNETIAFRGDRVEGVLIVLKGKVITEMLTENGSVRRIEELGASSILASAFIFGNKNFFPIDLVAKNKVQILYIEKKEFLKLLEENKKLIENFLDEISTKAQYLANKIWITFNNKTIKNKIINYINTNQKDSLIEIPNLRELAESFGVARPSLSRVLKEMIDEKKIEKIDRKTYKIKSNFY